MNNLQGKNKIYRVSISQHLSKPRNQLSCAKYSTYWVHVRLGTSMRRKSVMIFFDKRKPCNKVTICYDWTKGYMLMILLYQVDNLFWLYCSYHFTRYDMCNVWYVWIKMDFWCRYIEIRGRNHNGLILKNVQILKKKIWSFFHSHFFVIY